MCCSTKYILPCWQRILLWDLSYLFYYKTPQNFYITYSEFNPNSTEANKSFHLTLWGTDHYSSLDALCIRKITEHNHGAQNRQLSKRKYRHNLFEEFFWKAAFSKIESYQFQCQKGYILFGVRLYTVRIYPALLFLYWKHMYHFNYLH